MESIRERSAEITRAQSRSRDVISRVHRFLDEVDAHYRELENYERMKNMRIMHRQRESEIKHVQNIKKQRTAK